MLLAERHEQQQDYRYGFQGQEHDDELKGDGNSWNYKFRMHDARVARFFSIDPLAPQFPHNAPYAFSENSVIAFIELEGLEKTYYLNSLWYSNYILDSKINVVSFDKLVSYLNHLVGSPFSDVNSYLLVKEQLGPNDYKVGGYTGDGFSSSLADNRIATSGSGDSDNLEYIDVSFVTMGDDNLRYREDNYVRIYNPNYKAPDNTPSKKKEPCMFCYGGDGPIAGTMRYIFGDEVADDFIAYDAGLNRPDGFTKGGGWKLMLNTAVFVVTAGQGNAFLSGGGSLASWEGAWITFDFLQASDGLLSFSSLLPEEMQQIWKMSGFLSTKGGLLNTVKKVKFDGDTLEFFDKAGASLGVYKYIEGLYELSTTDETPEQ